MCQQSYLQKEAIILKLTACFEGAHTVAQERKTEKYLELVSEAEGKGHNVELVTM